MAGIEHIHNTKGQKNYTDSTTNSYRIGTVACADCPMGYVCDMVEIQEDYTIAEDENLKIPDGGILMLGDGVTLTNNGTLTFGSNSSFNAGEGTYTGKGAVKIGDSDGIIFENELYYYGETLDMSITNPTYFKAGEGYAIFDPSVAILTLNNATITGAGYEGNSYAVYYDRDLIINFSGTNTIAGDNTEGDNSVGILVGGALTLDGTSNSILNVKGGAATSTSMGAKCKDTLTVNGGTVNAIGGTSLSSCGIFSGDIIVNEGATLNAVGGSADAESAGIASSGDISGNVNGIVYSPAGDDGYIYFTVYGNATLGADFTPGDYGSMSEYFSNTTTFFIIPEETSLTVPEGVTLDLTQLDSDNICIQGEVINNGNISCNHYENKLTYTGSGATITVKCSDCGMENSITLTALGGEYKGTAYEASYDEPTGLWEGTALEIIYADEEGNPLDSAPVDVGTYTASITVSDQTASVEYTITPVELTVTEAIAKDKVYDGTQEVEITGVTLDGVVSDEDVSVDVSDLSGTVRSKNAGTYTSVVLPELTLIGEDIANYILIQPEVVNSLVTIEPDEAEITVGAETYKKTYGDAAFALDVTDSNPDVDVQYEVTSGADVVSVSDGMVTILKAGTADIKVILPKSENYKAAEVTVTVTVDKAKDAPNMPAATRNVAKNVQRVSDVTLPDGWTWQDADEAVELKAGVETNATAIYTDEDKDSYENVTVIVAITRDVCEHADTEILGKVEATCTVYGYTGDTYCKDCETTIEKGTATEPLGHTYTSKVTKEPTCAESGERTYTCACGDSYTEAIAKVAHSYTSKVTKEPTTKEEGIRTYTCTNCNHSYTESIAKLTETVHEHSYSSTVTKEATCTEAGERTYTCACGNSYTEEIAKLEHIWDSGKVTKEATATEAGEKTYTCQVCGSTKAEAIEATAVLLKKGDKVVDKNSNAIYKVTKAGATGGTVQFVSLINKNVKTVKIPKTITTGGITYKVTSIAKNACKGNKKLIKVTIGSNVKTIGTNAFYGCSKLKTVTMGKNVTTIGNKAFYKCTAITKITIPSKVTKIGKQAFYGCKKLKTITVNSKKLTSKKVGTNAFKGIHKKATIKVPTAKLKAYKSMLKKKGIGAEVKVKKK